VLELVIKTSRRRVTGSVARGFLDCSLRVTKKGERVYVPSPRCLIGQAMGCPESCFMSRY
jgi:hypothetical protein